ncbi:caspase family protein [Rhizobium sp. BK251]|uniref:caspase family protein n=1 Tax=Rhizobium sp. BK251 TaxID=2512125 RepID=UPI00104BFF12|nr:caspase family protein [Rhizobium sp. BK251]TCL68451.1 hypothetical protein EV286_109381 [Rhizobium sp. BK251]
MNKLGNEATEESDQENAQSSTQSYSTTHDSSPVSITNKARYVCSIAADRFSSPIYMSARSRLRYSVEGAFALATAVAALASSDPPSDVHDEDLTRISLEKAFRKIGERDSKDDCELILVLSGHGDHDTKETWFCTYEAQPEAPDLTGRELAALVMLARPTKLSAIFDFCHAGGVAKDFCAALSEQLGTENVLVLAGASSEQLAYEHPALGRGLFTIALHEALLDRRLFALAGPHQTEAKSDNTVSPSGDLARLFVFARERTEQLAYLFAGGRVQTPELYGAGHTKLSWSDTAVGPPVAPEPRSALAGRIRRTFGWGVTISATVCLLLYFLQYHIAVQPNGWIELRPGPSWMASLVPEFFSSGVQLAIAADDLQPASPRWDEKRILSRTALMRGDVSGLVNHRFGDQENWEFRLSSELSTEAARRVDFVSSRMDMTKFCESTDIRRDKIRDYQFAVEAALLDRDRSCPARYFLLNGPEINDLYDVKSLQTSADYGLLNLSDQVIRTYMAGLALAYIELRDDSDRRQALEAAILLISYRAERGVVRQPDWLSFLRFVEDIARSPILTVEPNNPIFPRLVNCGTSWCELPMKIVEYFAAGPKASGMGSARGMMMWLMAKDSERQALEGDATRSWSLPPILLLAQRGELEQRDLDLIIRRFGMFAVNEDMFFLDETWLPRFARVLPLSDEWKKPLLDCALGSPGNNIQCLPVDSQLAARVLAAQGRFLGGKDLSQLASRLDSRIKQERDIPAYASEMIDLACWTPLPERWVSGLERGVDYDIKVAPPRAADPLTGVQIIEVTDVSVAQALAASLKTRHGSSPMTADLLVKYAANHLSYTGLDIVYRALAQSLSDFDDTTDPVRSLHGLASDAQARAVVLRALSNNMKLGPLTDPRIIAGPRFWRLDAVLAVRKQLGDYQFELDRLCE